MSAYPSEQLKKAYNLLKDQYTGEVVFGHSKEHKLIKSRISDCEDINKSVTYTYVHYDTTVCDIDIYRTGLKVPFIFAGYSQTDRDNINGLLALIGITDYKAYIKDGILCVRRIY